MKRGPKDLMRWTAMVEMMPYNKLRKDCVDALREMITVGSSSEHVLMAQLRANDEILPRRYVFAQRRDDYSTKAWPSLKNVRFAVMRRRGTNGFPGTDTTSSKQSSRIPLDSPILDGDDPLKDFLYRSMSEYPAQHYLLILSGHSEGEFFGNTVPSVQQALDELNDVSNGQKRKIDILGLDNCLMTSVEVCYQLRDHVGYLVGAQGFDLSLGWAYGRVLDVLATDPHISPREFALKMIKVNVEHYSDYALVGLAADQAACDLTEFMDLVHAIGKFAGGVGKRLADYGIRESVLLARARCQSYRDNRHVDLYDFCDLLSSDCNDDEIRHLCEMVRHAIDERIVASEYSGSVLQYSHGLSIYFPWPLQSDDLNVYGILAFAKATNWDRFLHQCKEHLSRPRRRDPGDEIPPFFMKETTDAELWTTLNSMSNKIEAVAAEVHDRVGARIDGLLRGPVLDNYSGFLTVRVSHQIQKEKAIERQTIFYVALQPEAAGEICAPVEIRDGIRAEQIEFRVELVCPTLRFEPKRAPIRVRPGEQSPEIRFVCVHFAARRRKHRAYVQLFQKNRLILVLPVDIESLKG